MANNSHRIAPLFLFLVMARTPGFLLPNTGSTSANAIVPQKSAIALITFLRCKHWTLEYVAMGRNYLE
jgi:hypothetical protein